MNKDLTVGKPDMVLWKFCIPLLGSIIFQQMYNIADSLVAGKWIGEHALAAVGNSYEITLIFIAFAFGCNMGCSVVVSRLFGAQRYKDMKTAVYTALISSGVVCLCLMAAGFLGGRWLLQAIHTPTNIFADSSLYLRIYIGGLPFLFFYNISTGIFSALGDSRTHFFFLAASSTANILVDILFVAVFDMGVAGVAWATFICQGISCVLAVFCVLKRLAGIGDKERVPVFSLPILKEIAVVAVPSICQQSFISLGNIIIQGVVNGFGSSVVAGYSAAIKLDNLVITSFTTLGNGISNYTAQNIGAGKISRVQQGFLAGVKMVGILCVPIIVVYMTTGQWIMRFFMNNPSMLAVHSGTMFLRIVSPFYLVISTKLVVDGILRGAGKMKDFMIATFAALFVRIILIAVLAVPFGYIGMWCAWPLGYSTGTVFSLYFYHKWKVQEKELC